MHSFILIYGNRRRDGRSSPAPFLSFREGNGRSAGCSAAGVDAIRHSAAFLLRNQALFKQNPIGIMKPRSFHGLPLQPLIAGLPFPVHDALRPPGFLIV